MQCQKCNVTNDADSKFCKECGAHLGTSSAVSITQSDDRIRIGELIYTAYKHKEAGSIDDAILACQGALALKEEHAPAHSLLGSLYEAKGDIASAIRQYERALELNPDNNADYRKLVDLKSGRIENIALHPSNDIVEKLKPYIPFTSAAICGIAILVLGLTLVRGPVETAQEVEGATRQPTNVPIIQGDTIMPMTPYVQSQYPYGQQFPGYHDPEPEQTEADPAAVAQAPANEQQQQQPRTPASEQEQPERSQPPALRVEPIEGSSAGTNQSRSGGQSALPAIPDASNQTPVITPVIEPSNSASSSPAAPAPAPSPAPSPPLVVHHNTTPPASVDPEQRARRLQSEGKYQEAISAYRESLSNAGNPGRIHQQMALCYQRLNQHDKAIDSYNQAIRAYRNQRAAGRDSADVDRDIRACEAGIEVSRSRLN